MTCNFATVISMTPTHSRIVINQEPTNTLTYDLTGSPTPETITDIEISRTATGSTGPVKTGGYKISVQFMPEECKSFTINPLTISDQNVEDYKDSFFDFTDPGDEAKTNSKCGSRSFKLLDADNGDAVLSSTFISMA